MRNNKTIMRKNKKIVRNKKKILLPRIIVSLKVGWNAAVLPLRVINIHNNPWVRVFIITGGLSTLAVLSKEYLLFVFPLNIIVLFFALLYFIYIMVIIIIKLFNCIGVLTSDKFLTIVKNYPLYYFDTTLGKLLFRILQSGKFCRFCLFVVSKLYRFILISLILFFLGWLTVFYYWLHRKSI